MITCLKTTDKLNKFYKSKDVLITGASGFVGKALTKRMREYGAKVWAYDSKNGKNILDSEALHRSVSVLSLTDGANIGKPASDVEPSVVFHLAALTEVRDSFSRMLDYMLVNVQGTANVIDACRRHPYPIHLVYGSSDKVYGDRLNACDERVRGMGNSDLYSFTKMAADELFQLAARNYRMRATILRPGNIFGPGQTNDTTLITGTINRLIKGDKPVMYGGSRYSVREWVYIDDVIDAYALAGADLPVLGSPEVYNVGSHQRFSVEAVIGKLLSMFGKSVFDFDLEADSLPQTGSQKIECHRFMRKFPMWSPTGFEDGLRKTVEWHGKGVRE